jgi:trimethylamine--corrinoid protein Co-methyltransferase
MLTAEEMESIHGGALYVLEKTGMRIEHPGALSFLAENGCSVDLESERVRFPAWLVEECLRKVPTHFRLRARDPNQDLMVGGNTFYFMQGMGMQFVDLDTWEIRPATVDEHRQAMIVADALPNVHLAEAWEIYTEREGVPPVMVMLENLANGIRYSTKAQVAGNIQDSEVFAIELAQAVGIDLFPEIEHASPLMIGSGGVDAAFRYMDAGMPICPALGVAMGAQGPATIAGSLVLQVAETMGWAVLTQLHRPGAPIGGVGFNHDDEPDAPPLRHPHLVQRRIRQRLKEDRLPGRVREVHRGTDGSTVGRPSSVVPGRLQHGTALQPGVGGDGRRHRRMDRPGSTGGAHRR